MGLSIIKECFYAFYAVCPCKTSVVNKSLMLSIVVLSVVMQSVIVLSVMPQGICEICVEQNILVMDETKQYEIL